MPRSPIPSPPNTRFVSESHPPTSSLPPTSAGLSLRFLDPSLTKIAARPSLSEMLAKEVKVKTSLVPKTKPPAKVVKATVADAPPPSQISKRSTRVEKARPARVEKEKDATSRAPPASLLSGLGLQDSSQDKIISKFIATCLGGGLQSMSSLLTEILATKGTSLLAEV